MKTIKEEGIGGIELTYSIRFNLDDNRRYVEIVNELMNKFEAVIDELGHDITIGTGKPILNSELEE